MKVDEKIKKCVGFLQYKDAQGKCYYAGTCFFIIKDRQANKYCYLVTAKHVVEKIKGKIGHQKPEVFVKINLTTGGTNTSSIPFYSWIYHHDTDVDVVVCPFAFPNNADHLYYPESAFLNKESILSNEIDCGDEVIITGLFTHHHGNEKNLPIIRTGNIAMMTGEKVRVTRQNEKQQLENYSMDAYLIESRSIGGLSGSPVFVNLGLIRKRDGQIQHAAGNHIPLLLGIVHGHFDAKMGDIDSVTEDAPENKKINVGIAIVTPISKLLEVLTSEKIKIHEKEVDIYLEKIRLQNEEHNFANGQQKDYVNT